MQRHLQHFQALKSQTKLSFFSFFIGFAAACTDSSAPTPPAAPANGSTETNSASSSDTVLEAEAAMVDGSDETSDPAFTGANVGSGETQEDVAVCNAEGKFYDRYADDGEGACTKAKLAKVDCAIDSLRSLLKNRERSDFATVTAEIYADYEIDQCLDCPPGNRLPLCKSESGTRQIGTKVFFVRENDDVLEGASRLLSIRPDSGDDD